MGRWQKNKDLSWYAKGDSSQAATDAANARKEEIRRIKEAEQDALSEALGFPVQPRLRDSQLAEQKEVDKALKDTAEGDEEGGKGVGFGSYAGANGQPSDAGEVMQGHGGDVGGLEGGHLKAEKRRYQRRRSRSPRRRDKSSRRSRSRDRNDGRRRRHQGRDGRPRREDADRRYHHRSRSRSGERDRNRHRDARRYQDDRAR